MMLCTRRLRWAALAGLLLAVGCNDGIPCPGPAQLVFASPTSSVTTDLDSVTPGTQAAIRLRTTLPTETEIVVEVWQGDVRIAEHSVLVADGGATIDSATLPDGPVILRARAESACGVARDEVSIDVIAGVVCGIDLQPAPTTKPFYAPVPVLNSTSDLDALTVGLQSRARVRSLSGWRTELFVRSHGVETPAGSVLASPTGIAEFALTYPEGRVDLRTTCFGPRGEVVNSPVSSLFVDSMVPSCELTAPGTGTILNPGYDNNGSINDGLQVDVVGRVVGSDIDPASPVFTFAQGSGAQLGVAGTAPALNGVTTATLNLMPTTTPTSFTLGVVATDHAGNLCRAQHEYPVVYNGCNIRIASPLNPVTIDADGNSSNGAQVDVLVQIAQSCAGRTVTSDCANAPSAVVPASGNLTLSLNVCATLPCESKTACGFSVSNNAGVETRSSTVIEFDNVGPTVDVRLGNGLRCGDTVTASDDINGNVPGVQIAATIHGDAAASSLAIANAQGTTSIPGPDVEVTLAIGRNALTATAIDAAGNRTTLSACDVALTNLAVKFTGGASDGIVGLSDGNLAGGVLTTQVCGVVSEPGASVAISVDGGAAGPAVVNGTSWCRTINVVATPAAHLIVADAVLGASFGRSSLALVADVSRPNPIASVTLVATNRQSGELNFNAPSENGMPMAAYVARVATVPLTDSNFDSTGNSLAVEAPSSPGSPEIVEALTLRAGVPYWIAVAVVDSAGNRSAPSVLGPMVPQWDQTGGITAPNPTLGNLGAGAAIAHGKFNNDDFDDLAIGAPNQSLGAAAVSGAVYVYFGGAAGIKNIPDVVILGGASEAFGTALTAMPSGDRRHDDLFVGAPRSNNGRVYVFRGATMVPGTRSSASADALITTAVTAGWFVGSRLGSRLGVGQIDDDDVADLVIAAPSGGGNVGGAVVMYGGSWSGSVALSDVDRSGFNGAVVDLIADPQGLVGRGFGSYAHVVGRTRAGSTRDDILLSYSDDATSSLDTAYVFRSGAARAAANTISRRNFTVGNDVRIDYVATSNISEWASQATTIDDVDGDGVRELVISAYRNGSEAGQIKIIRGDIVGDAQGVAVTSAPSVVLTTINGTAGQHLGAALAVVRRGGSRGGPDVDGDSSEELVSAGVSAGVPQLMTWFHDQVPIGVSTSASASHLLRGPSTFGFVAPLGGGVAAVASWIGDVNRDGLDDICWSSPNDNNRDGSFEVLWDDQR
jgi:hypothetical protein